MWTPASTLPSRKLREMAYKGFRPTMEGDRGCVEDRRSGEELQIAGIGFGNRSLQHGAVEIMTRGHRDMAIPAGSDIVLQAGIGVNFCE